MKSLRRIVKDTRLALCRSVLFSSSVTTDRAFLFRKQTSSSIKQGLESHRHHPHALVPVWDREGGWDRAGMGQAAGPHPGLTGAAALQTAWHWQAKDASQEEGAQVLMVVLPFKLVF